MVIIILLIVIISLFVYASYSIEASVYVKSLCRADCADSVAITFDDGVDPVITPKVLDILAKYGAKATFFVIGERAEAHPEIVRRIVDEGHNIGIHSYYHRWSSTICDVESEIERCREVIGRDTILYRAPFGVTNPIVAKAVAKCGVISIGWSIRSFDTLGHSVERVCDRVCRRVKGGDVILLHDNRDGADILLEMILKGLYLKGLHSQTITNLFNLEPK